MVKEEGSMYVHGSLISVVKRSTNIHTTQDISRIKRVIKDTTHMYTDSIFAIKARVASV